MLPDEKVIALNLRSRPLRLAYLVTCLEDLKNAVKLYTDTWGGAANVLLPVYDDENKIQQLHGSLIKFDPDYILFTGGKELPQKIKNILESYPARCRSIHQDEIKKFVDLEDKIYLQVGNLSWSRKAKLPHIYSVLKNLDRTPVKNSRIRLLDISASKFDTELSLQIGITSQFYHQYLIQYLDATVITTPKNSENLFKASLCLSTSVNPASLSLTNLKIQQRCDWFCTGLQDEPLALCLFLYEKNNLDILTLFWNTRWFYFFNKLLFPKQEFLDDLEHYVNLALSAIPSLKAIHIATNVSKDEAEDLQSDIKSKISQIAERDLAVRVSYRDFYEEVRKVAVYTGLPRTTSQKLHSDNSIRFLPETPSGLKTNDFAFGYDAELNLDPGSKLLFPRVSEISTLLSNSLKSIEYRKAQNIINEQLPAFLANGLVRRGMSLKCPVCDLETWYSLSSLGEFVDCEGCLEKFQLENLEKAKYSYVPNELSRRLIENGGIAVLATASLFQMTNPPSFIQFGGDLFEFGQKSNFAEIDLIAIAGDILAIAECKYFPKLDSEEQIQKALSPGDGLEKAITVAERIGAYIVLLGVSTNLEKSDKEIVDSLKRGVANLAEDAKAKGIGVYLELTGSGVDSDPYRVINLKDLIPATAYNQQEREVGDLPSSLFIDEIYPFDEEVLKRWESQILS